VRDQTYSSRLRAPEIHAFFSGTRWSMSTSDDAVQVAPSSGLYRRPEVEAQAGVDVPARGTSESGVRL
jgi:hypothetical protein